MTAPPCIVIDFETLPIQQRPEYPPKPVGVAIKLPGEPGQYLAWGHTAGNNCDPHQARMTLCSALESRLPILCHNAKFDLGVTCEGLGLPELPWQRVHDTMFLAYLCDPHARSLGLKPLAADLLNWPASEREELDAWIWDHRAQLEQAYPQYGKVSKKSLGAWIFAAPGELVGRYAVGDVERTAALFEHLWPIVQDNGMGPAYDRERQLLPILMENERIGLRVDQEGLERDIEGYSWHMDTVEAWLRKELRAGGLNFDADADVAAILLKRGVVPADKWQRTKATKAHPNGQLSVSKDNLLPEYFTDPRIASALGYRNRLKTCLEMFMKPWSAQSARNKGHITTNWNQVRGTGKGGTRSGRPSTDKHNFLNISKDFETKSDGFVHPAFLNVASLPLCRKYLLPDDGEVWLHRDFDGQEMRVFAHYEQGALFDQYAADPMLDPHAYVGDEMMRVAAREIDRTTVKALNFQSLYGGGVPALQNKVRCSYADAKQLKAFHGKALPGRKILNEEIMRVVRRGDPIRTWGGRLYYVEPPGFSKKYGKNMTYEYKLINYACQGSAADLTKQAIIDWHGAAGRTARFLVTVYDEINVSASPGNADSQMELLRDVMEERRLTVPMRSSGKQGPTWGDLVKCE